MANGGYYWVSGKLVYQRDDTAEGIINTIQITDGVTLTDAQKFYVRYIVTNLIRLGIWTKIKALYGFVGGTAATHRWNWKDMRDLDAAFRILWSGTITHDSFGIRSATGGFGNTILTPSVNLSTTISIGAYVNQNLSPTGAEYTIGATLSDNFNNSLITSRSNGSSIFVASGYNSANQRGDINGGLGMYIGSYITQASIFYNGIKGTTSNFNNHPNKANIPLYILATNGGDSTQKRISFAHIGDGLTDQECILMSNIITFAQGILGRQ